MEKNCTFLITALAIFFAVSGAVFGEWLAPVLMDEINDNSGYNPESPCLSSDELTLYYGKFNPDRGHKCIYEARRESTCDSFVNTRVLEELIVEGTNMNGAWISNDSQRLYYHEGLAEGGGRVKMATLNMEANLWVPTEIFNELGTSASVSLTSDELIIAGHMTSDDSSIELFIASRESVDLPFGNLRMLSELNTINADTSPHLSSDGLTVYFGSSERYGKPTNDFYKSNRQSLEDIFANVELIEFPGYNSMYENNCFISSDKNTMYFYTGAGIWEMRDEQAPCVPGNVAYFVDAENGDDSNTGLERENAFATITRGIEACEDDNTVYVLPGVYYGVVDFAGKAITISGLDGVAIIDGQDGFGVTFFNGEDHWSVLQNFVIRNSYIGIFMSASSPTIRNVTVIGNTYGIEAYQQRLEVNITNCIAWDNISSDLYGCMANYSCIERGSEGVGNISENPLFVDADGGDYRLLSERGRYHAGYGVWVLDEVTSPCINTGDPVINPSNEPGANGGRVNMGAYGDTKQASMGEWVLKGDLNRDGKVNLSDLAEIAAEWLIQLEWVGYVNQ